MQLYGDGESAAAIARRFGVCDGTILHHARKAGLTPIHDPVRERPCQQCGKSFMPPNGYREQQYCSRECRRIGFGASVARTKLHPNTVRVSGGYARIIPPRDHVSRSKKGHRIPQHVFIAEVALGRPLKASEVVHHINGDTLDNRNCNLLVCTRSYHHELHARMSRMYQREKFARVA